MRAKALIESAFVIPAQKKRKRIIDSDDENSSEWNPAATSVDDIGMIDSELVQLTEQEEPQKTENEVPVVSVKSEIAQTNNIEGGPSESPARVQLAKPPPYSIPVVIDLVNVKDEPNDEPSYVPMTNHSRRTIQVKIEKQNVNNLLPKKTEFESKKTKKDIFDTPLNALVICSCRS